MSDFPPPMPGGSPPPPMQPPPMQPPGAPGGMPPAPPPGGGYMPPAPPPGGGFMPPAQPYGSGGGGVSPYGTWMIVLAVVGLCCCPPVSIAALVWSMMERKKYPDDSKVTIAMVVSIVALVLWVVGFVYSMATGSFAWDVPTS